MTDQPMTRFATSSTPEERRRVLESWWSEASSGVGLAGFRQQAFELAQQLGVDGHIDAAQELYRFAWTLAPDDMEAGAPDDYALLHHAAVQSYLEQVAAEHTVVFITGCARSGTSLLRRCMATVKDPVYYSGENSLAAIWKQRRADGRHLILKRRAQCYGFFHTIPAGVRVIHCVRDPLFVLSSRVPKRQRLYVTADRWRSEWRAFRRLREAHPPDNLAIVRYEDLLADPDGVQERLGETLRLEFELPFSRHQERASVETKIDPHTGLLKVWEPIDPHRPQRNRQDLTNTEEVQQSIGAAEPDISQFCREFGYPPASERSFG